MIINIFQKQDIVLKTLIIRFLGKFFTFMRRKD